MNRIFGYILVGLLGLLVACKGAQEGEKVLGPEETVAAFCRAVAAGDMEQAQGLCDVEAMRDYLDGWERSWNELAQKDSSALRIASGMLSEAAFTVIKVERAGDERIVAYSLEADGRSKTRQAVVTKVEGVWRVRSLTDVQ